MDANLPFRGGVQIDARVVEIDCGTSAEVVPFLPVWYLGKG